MGDVLAGTLETLVVGETVGEEGVVVVVVVGLVEVGGIDEEADEVVVVTRVTVVVGGMKTETLSKKRLYVGPIWAMLVCKTERMTVENLGSQTEK